jgi:hypothetical protein
MQYPICRHIKTNGLQCQSPALRHTEFCYFHYGLLKRHTGFRHTETTSATLIPGKHIQLSPLEDRESVQLAISTVVNALATGQIETQRATAILYGLQLASHNASHLNTEPSPRNVVLTVQPSPDGHDLAEPGAVIDILDESEIDYNEDDEDDDDEDEDEEDDEDDDTAARSLTINSCEEYSSTVITSCPSGSELKSTHDRPHPPTAPRPRPPQPRRSRARVRRRHPLPRSRERRILAPKNRRHQEAHRRPPRDDRQRVKP